MRDETGVASAKGVVVSRESNIRPLARLTDACDLCKRRRRKIGEIRVTRLAIAGRLAYGLAIADVTGGRSR
jgi:hypothetical protein